MPGSARIRAAAALGMAMLLASCAHHATPVAVTTAPRQMPPRPELPEYLGAITPPARAADGSYETINSGIGPQQQIWHVRAALNVAAIGCRGGDNGAALTAAYNSLLNTDRVTLDKANKAVEADFRARYGKGWQKAHDAYMTRLYNFFAMPAAKPGFCAAATALAPKATAVPASELASFSATALPELEAPFLAVYRQIDDYHAQLAAWDAHRGRSAERVPVEVAVAAASTRSASHGKGRPRLNYANMGELLAWQAPRGVELALR